MKSFRIPGAPFGLCERTDRPGPDEIFFMQPSTRAKEQKVGEEHPSLAGSAQTWDEKCLEARQAG
jgi:hypothetical protein